MAGDYSTPEGAWKSLEAAYAAEDIEAAVAARNFAYEAAAMLRDVQGIADPTPQQIQQAARNLESAFRKQLEGDGFPQRSKLIAAKVVRPELAEIVYESTFPDGSVAKETTYAAKSDGRWGIVELYEV